MSPRPTVTATHTRRPPPADLGPPNGLGLLRPAEVAAGRAAAIPRCAARPTGVAAGGGPGVTLRLVDAALHRALRLIHRFAATFGPVRRCLGRAAILFRRPGTEVPGLLAQLVAQVRPGFRCQQHSKAG